MSSVHERYRRYLEDLSSATLGDLETYVTADVRFKDPFNDVRGVDAMRRIFQHMFENVQDVKFRAQDMASEGPMCLMSWHFEGKLRGNTWAFDGASIIRFAEDGRVTEHIDHWDAGGAFYERLPIIGLLLAFLRRRLAVV
ncbi:MAG: nuclear transport factor 2 family protein [Pseudomonadota bacterium]|nr:nuclear transport factor 2 family protein [Pseudomonadota bacterium]